jgi:predicted dehydrogenase
MDVGCYCVSGSRLVAGEPVEASARQVLGPSGIDMRLAGTLVFPGDVLAELDCGFDLPDRQGLELVGSDGILRIEAPWAIDDPGIEYVHGHDRDRVEIARADRYRLQSDNFSRAVRGVELPLLGREDALGQARTIDALYRSAEAGGETFKVEA